MNKSKASLLLAVIVLLVAAPLALAQEESTIVEIAVNDGRFDTLVAAVTAAGLADALSGGEWTVFAPTDDAFAKLGLNPSNIAGAFSKAELTDVLLYHALDSEVSQEKAKTLLGDVTMANGKIAGLKWFDGNLYVNDDSKVIIPDIVASNGVIHVVDTVILGPWPRTEEAPAPAAEAAPAAEPAVEAAPAAEPAAEAAPEPTAAAPADNSIVGIAVNDGRFDTLVAAVTAAGLADALSGGEWTVFAPTDDAFAKLDLNASNIAGAFSKAELTDVLLYHALDSEVSQEKAKTLLGDVTMANGKIAGLKWFDGNLYVNDDSKVIIPDIVASNGVIHVVDTVILGPWPRMDE
jgi:transforming growth factor-beta-induced protein